MTAVVLARGEGRRMREPATGASLSSDQAAAAAAGRKVMMPIEVGGRVRPFLAFVLDSLAAAGFSQACLVIAPHQDDVRDFVRETRLPLDVVFAIQDEPAGTANAVLSVEAITADEPFAVVNADNLYAPDALAALRELHEPGLPAFVVSDLIAASGIPIERIATFALIETDGDGILQRIVEKPGLDRLRAAGEHARVSMNAWRFDSRVFDCCRRVRRSIRGEYELPGAVALAVSEGMEFHVVPVSGPVLDLSCQQDVAVVGARLAALAGCL